MQKIRSSVPRIDLQTILVGIFILATIFSVEYPVFQSISEYASVNSEDIALLLLSTFFIYMIWSKGELKLTLPLITVLISLASLWILITVTIAIIRSPVPVTPSILWQFKWFAAVISFIIFQNVIEKNAAYASVHLILISGLILASYSIFQSISGAFRIRVFFGNPNTLSAFFTMVATLSMSKSITDRSILCFVLSVLSIAAVITTGSRSGMLGLIIALSIVFVLIRSKLKGRDYFAILSGLGLSSLVIPQLLDESVVERLTAWVSITGEGVVLTDRAGSFRTRWELIEKAIELTSQQPIFGFGWYASPSRVGYLDVYYSTLLVEVGIVGFILFIVIHISIIRSWLIDRRNGAFAIGSAAAAWYCGLLIQSIGGSFPRTPQLLLLTFVLLVSSQAIAHSSVEETSIVRTESTGSPRKQK